MEHIHIVQYLSACSASIPNASNIAKSTIRMPTSGCVNLCNEADGARIVSVIPTMKIITARFSGCPPLMAEYKQTTTKRERKKIDTGHCPTGPNK
jgi:hypothetical protein